MAEFGQPNKVSHHHGKHGMSRYSGEYTHNAYPPSSFNYIHDIFGGGKTHRNHHGINDTIQGFIKCFSPIRQNKNKKEFTSFFYITGSDGGFKKCTVIDGRN